MARLEFKLLNNFEDIEDFEERWDELLPRSSYCSIFQTFNWHRCWLECFGESLELFVLLALDKDKLVGIAPLCIETKRVNGIKERILSFIGVTNLSSDYVDFIIESGNEEILDGFLLTLRQRQKKWTIFSWPNMPGFSVNRLRTEEYFKLRKYSPITTFLYDAPAWKRDGSSDDSEILEKKSFKRKEKALSKQGAVAFQHIADRDEAKRLLSILVAQHKERWNSTKYPSLFNDERQVIFFERLIDTFLPLEILRFSELSLNGEPVALHFGFQYGGSYLWYKPSYDQAYSEQSPGQVILKHLLQYASDNNLKEFDFGCGSEFFKYRFSNHVKKIYRLDIYNRRISTFLAQLRVLIRRLKKKKKS